MSNIVTGGLSVRGIRRILNEAFEKEKKQTNNI